MRNVEIEDLNRAILTQLYASPGTMGPWGWEEADGETVTSRLHLRIDPEAENAIVSYYLGPLTYRSREQIVHPLAALTGWEEDPRKRRLDLLRYWDDEIAQLYLVPRETFYVKPDRFEWIVP